MRARVWAGTLLLLLVAGSRLVFGQDASSRTVEVVLVGGGTETGALVDTMRELLGRLGLVPNVHAVGTIEDAGKIERGSSAARVQIDLRSGNETTITAENKDGATHTRTLRKDPSASIAREELAHAVQTVVEAQLFPDGLHHGEPDAGVAPPVPEPAPTVTAPPPAVTVEPTPSTSQRDTGPPAPKSPFALDVGIMAGGAGFADNSGPVARLGAGASLVWRKGWRPSAGIVVDYVIPFDASGKDVAAHTSDLALRTMFGVQPIHTSWLGIGAGAGVGLDAIMVDPRAISPVSSLAQPTTRVDPILAGSIGADLAIVSPVVLSLRFLADVDLGDTHHYVMRSNAGDEVVFSPWRVRPAIMLGLTFTPLGMPAFAKRGAP